MSSIVRTKGERSFALNRLFPPTSHLSLPGAQLRRKLFMSAGNAEQIDELYQYSTGALAHAFSTG